MRTWVKVCIVTLISLAGATFIYSALKDVERQVQEDQAWEQWAWSHCKIISVSSGGLGAASRTAYRCDDGHDYVSFAERPPENWTPR